MNSIKSNTNMTTDKTVLTRAEQVRQAFVQSKIVKAVRVAAIATVGLLAIGGLFRMLAWVTTGWNQLASAMTSK
jgi:hypothetical protein